MFDFKSRGAATVYVNVDAHGAWGSTSSGRAWRLGGEGDWSEWARSAAAEGALLRMAASPRHYGLIADVLEMADGPRIEVAHPRYLPRDGGERPGGGVVGALARAGEALKLPGSVGGWGAPLASDAPVYRGAAEVRSGGWSAPERVRMRVTRPGPVLEAVAATRTARIMASLCDPLPLAVVMAWMVAPRFHVLSSDSGSDDPWAMNCLPVARRWRRSKGAPESWACGRYLRQAWLLPRGHWPEVPCDTSIGALARFYRTSPKRGPHLAHDIDYWLAMFLRDVWRDCAESACQRLVDEFQHFNKLKHMGMTDPIDASYRRCSAAVDRELGGGRTYG